MHYLVDLNHTQHTPLYEVIHSYIRTFLSVINSVLRDFPYSFNIHVYLKIKTHRMESNIAMEGTISCLYGSIYTIQFPHRHQW